VIAISLTLSWVASITLTPLLGYALFKPRAGGDRGEDPYRGAFFQGYRRLLVLSLRFRWAVLVIALGLFVAAVYGFGRVPQNFFPPATRPQFLVDTFLPAGTHIRDSEAFAQSVEQFLLEQPNGPELFARMIDRLDAKSSSYIIEAMGYTEEGRTFRTLWALVRRSVGMFGLLHRLQERENESDRCCCCIGG
jgi:multidrug efflux pump subunit AcrB